METKPDTAPVAQKSRRTYILLGIFLGGLGIHNFYAGRKKPARIQLVLWLFFFITFLQSGASGNAEVALLSQLVVWGVWIWAFIELFTVKKDGQGAPFK